MLPFSHTPPKQRKQSIRCGCCLAWLGACIWESQVARSIETTGHHLHRPHFSCYVSAGWQDCCASAFVVGHPWPPWIFGEQMWWTVKKVVPVLLRWKMLEDTLHHILKCKAAALRPTSWRKQLEFLRFHGVVRVCKLIWGQMVPFPRRCNMIGGARAPTTTHSGKLTCHVDLVWW